MGTRRDSLASVPVAAVKARHMYVLAEKSWKQRTAEAMDMEVSSDDEDEDAPAAKKSRQPQQSNDGSSLAYMQRVSRQPLSRNPTQAAPPVHGAVTQASMACSMV